MLQLGLGAISRDIDWIGQWRCGGFRAARKAQPRDRLSGELSDGSCLLREVTMALIALVLAMGAMCSSLTLA